MNNSSDTIGNQTCDLLTRSAVPQPTAPPRTSSQTKAKAKTTTMRDFTLFRRVSNVPFPLCVCVCATCVLGIVYVERSLKGKSCHTTACYKFDNLRVSFNTVTLQFPFNRFCSFLHVFFPVAILKILLFASLNNYFIERRGEWGGNGNLSIKLLGHPRPICRVQCIWQTERIEWGLEKTTFVRNSTFGLLQSQDMKQDT